MRLDISETGARAEEAARASYGKLLAQMAARTGDIMAAEDALSDAFARALEVWPRDGVPERPEAWLMTTAKNKLIDAQRRARRIVVTDQVPKMPETTEDPDQIPDDRLRLMFVCAHPAIDAGIRTPLMLQTVLGIEAKQIANAFLIPPGTLSQRLVRAKRKIRDARIPFALPDASDTGARMSAVLEAVYGAYASDWLDDPQPLAEEAVFLSQILAELVPDNAEALGLCALTGFLHSRRKARVVEGVMVPLPEQDIDLWDKALTRRSAALLERAGGLGQIGRFQLEAAIQLVHADRAAIGVTDWRALSKLYAGLNTLFPTIGGAVSQAAVVAEDAGPEQGLVMLDKIDAGAVRTFQPAWAVRAHCLAALGRKREAHDAYETAIKLATHGPTRRWLEIRRQALITRFDA